MPKTLRWRLILAIVPVVIAGIVVVVGAQYYLSRSQILAGINQEIQNRAARTAAAVDSLLRQRRNDLLTLSDSPLISDYHHSEDYGLKAEAESYRRELEMYLLQFARRSAVYDAILFANARGRAVCRIEQEKALPPGEALGSAGFFVAARRLPSGAAWVSGPERLPDGHPVLYFAAPLRDEAKNFEGVLALAYDLGPVSALLKASYLGNGGQAWLQMGRQAFPGPPSGPGRPALVASVPLKAMPWTVMAMAPRAEFLRPLKRVRDFGIAIGVAAAAIVVLVILLFCCSNTRPLAALAEAAREIGRGRLDRRVVLADGGEMGALAGAFNEMARNLEDNRKSGALLRAQLIQSEKLSAVGQLISSVAHELNNPLAAVCGYVQIIFTQNPPESLREDLRRVHHSALRCRKAVENLLFFVRRSGGEKSRVDVNAAVRAALDLLEYRLKKTEDVAVDLDLASSMGEIGADFQQIVQVLVNLINNACDAMEGAPPRQEGKRIAVRTRQDAEKTEILVEDNGPGVPEAVRASVFEPFFTTKEPGRGTGLGLSICRQIAEEHGGTISFSNLEKGGASFRLLLPRSSPEDLAALKPVADAQESLPPVPGRRVLVVEDEKDIAQIIARFLHDEGDIADIVEPPEALRIATSRPYDLIISDFEMEKTKGPDLYEALIERDPGWSSKFLFVTGDILNPRVLEFLRKTEAACLAKPFDLEDLRRTVRRLLSRRRT